MQEIDRTNQNPKDEWRRFAPPLIFWVLCPTAITNQTNHKKFFESAVSKTYIAYITLIKGYSDSEALYPLIKLLVWAKTL
ncbi:hypothetical protein APA_798 [Pseudanabaena sp. lw0831]|nr:hypothetical protein APA_798 [Pseudanabaena sp. lw0831]